MARCYVLYSYRRRTRPSCSREWCSSSLGCCRRGRARGWGYTVSTHHHPSTVLPHTSKEQHLLSLLLVTKQIVDQHGGAISVHSTGEGSGTTFTVRLPCTVDSNSSSSNINGGREEDLFDLEADTKLKRTTTNARRRASMFRDQSLTASFSSIGAAAVLPIDINNALAAAVMQPLEQSMMRVLVVDDSDLNRKMICKALAATKEFLCEQAGDGRKAVEMVRAHMGNDDSNNGSSSSSSSSGGGGGGLYDIILMDYQMPVMDGPTAISEIRRLGYRGIILGLTGNALLSDAEVMVKAGANDVMVKPLDIDQFLEALRRLSSTTKKK